MIPHSQLGDASLIRAFRERRCWTHERRRPPACAGGSDPTLYPLPVLESPTKDRFLALVHDARSMHPRDTLVIPVCLRLLDDQLTPVLAYRRLVAPDERTAPSFLLESVE